MSAWFPPLRPVLLVLVLTSGLMSSAPGQAQATQTLTGGKAPPPAARGAEVTPSGLSSSGYWLVASDGGVFAFGDAHFDGSTAGIALPAPMVGIAATPDGKGYWLVASNGGVFAFGDAHFDGSTAGIALPAPMVGMAATPDGKGYWLEESNGGIFAFGDAHFFGSTGGIALAAPMVGMAATPDGKGYWLVASNGGVFAFGDAHFDGSTAGVALPRPIVGIAATDLPNPPPVSSNNIDGDHRVVNISCPTNGWCMAVDSSGNAINYSGGAWHTPVLVDPGSTVHADLGLGEFDAVSCPTKTFCMAVSNLDGYTIYNGARWSNIQWPPLGIGNTLHAVSCGSPKFCDAEVDNSGDQAQWNSGTWSETTEDQSLNVRIGQGPSNVSCAPSSTTEYCVYIDNYNHYAVYDNGTWVNRGSKLFAATYVAEVSCSAVRRCGAIDDNGDAITYNGSVWSSSSLVDPLGESAGAPADLSCVTGFCAAGDFGGNVIYDNAGSWSAPLAVDQGHITAVSCASNTFCVAVDFSGHALVLNPATP